MMKKALKIATFFLWIVVLILLCILLKRFITQEFPVVHHYNRANKMYREGEFNGAVGEYAESYDKNKNEKRDCDVRVNLALAIVGPLSKESITPENIQDAISDLETARKILLENGCAEEDPEIGHDVEAQILKDEIDEYLKELQKLQESFEQQQNSGQGSNNQDENQEQDDSASRKQQEMQEKLAELQKQGAQDRSQSLDIGSSITEFEYYNGNSW